MQLHGFSDVSKVEYGAAVYIRTVYKDTSLETHLVTTKTKVTPLKEITISRLELCTAHLLSQLLQLVANNLSMSIQYVYAWTDSSVDLGWLKCLPTRVKTFVANCVSDIVHRIPASQWRYVATADNPADDDSRGLLPQELLNHYHLWWKSPLGDWT